MGDLDSPAEVACANHLPASVIGKGRLIVWGTGVTFFLRRWVAIGRTGGSSPGLVGLFSRSVVGIVLEALILDLFILYLSYGALFYVLRLTTKQKSKKCEKPRLEGI